MARSHVPGKGWWVRWGISMGAVEEEELCQRGDSSGSALRSPSGVCTALAWLSLTLWPQGRTRPHPCLAFLWVPCPGLSPSL